MNTRSSQGVGAVIRAAIFAILVLAFAQGIWAALFGVNLGTSPTIPWSVPVMAVVLWLMGQYLAGKGWPVSTSEARRSSLRAAPVARPVFGWALLAGVLTLVALAGFWMVLIQLVSMPGNVLPGADQYPVVTLLLVSAMGSLVSAFCEEAGFRGYFQVELERNFRAPIAILISSLLIAPAHAITQGFLWPVMLFYFLVDVSYGTMAYLTKSILPSLVVHVIGLMIFFTTVWPYDATRPLVSAGGADLWFWIHAGQAIVFGILALLAFRRLAQVTATHRAA